MLFSNLPKDNPFQIFQDYYVRAEDHGDRFAEAGCISSVDKNNQPHSRFVNFKYFFEDNLIFFSNYKSHKLWILKIITPFASQKKTELSSVSSIEFLRGLK